jgi:16S rRNA (adenine1518-N6/adenine1519-N6)-dimethyltransferase
MTLMFQKEVAERLVAQPGDDAYGRLAVLTRTLSEPKIVMDLPARAFTPPPKVESAVVTLALRADRPDAATVRTLERVTQAAFGQRRKMLRSSLRPLGGEALLDRVGIEPSARAEEVPVEGFLRLAQALQSGSASSS